MQLTVQLSVKARRGSVTTSEPNVAVSDPQPPIETTETVPPLATEMVPMPPVCEETGPPCFVKITDTEVIVSETLEAWLAAEAPIGDNVPSGGETS